MSRHLALALVLLAAAGSPTTAQQEAPRREAELLAAINFYRGHNIGAKAPPSGLVRRGAQGVWEPLAWPELIATSWSVDASGRWIYLACGNGVMVSQDGGQSWRLTGGWELAETQRVCIDRRDPRRAWVASAYGLDRCEDVLSERSWTRFAHDGYFRMCSDVLQDASDPDTLWIASERGIFHSADGGRHVARRGPEVRVRRLLQDPADPRHLWATSDGLGLLETRDGGARWHTLPGSPGVCFCVARHPRDPAVLLCGATDGVHRSEDGGASWTRTATGLPEDFFTFGIAFDPRDAEAVYICGGDGVFGSADGGQSWARRGLERALAPHIGFERLAAVPRQGPSPEAGTLRIPGMERRCEDHRPLGDRAAEARRRTLLEHFITRLPGADAERIGLIQAILVARQATPHPRLRELVLAELENPAHSMFFSIPAIALHLHAGAALPSEVGARLRELLTEYPIYRGDTENHWVMYYTALLLAAQSFPETPAARWYAGRSTQSLYDEARGWLLHWARLTASRGQGEFDSPHYMFMFVVPMLLLHDFAEEPLMRQLGGMMLDLLFADYLCESLEGAYCGGHSRAPGRVALETRDNRAAVFHYLYAGGIAMPEKPYGWAILAALSSYRAPREFAAIANQRTRPFVHRERKRVRNVIRFGDTLNPPVHKVDYMTPSHCLGSLQGGILQPIQQHTWDVTWTGSAPNSTLFAVQPSVWGRELGMFFPEEVHFLTRSVEAQKSTYTSPEKWVSASPWEKVFQHENTLLALYQVPAGWRHPHVDLHWPRCLAREERGGWLFGRDGEFFLACYPLCAGAWRDEGPHERLRCVGERAAFVVVTPWPEVDGAGDGAYSRFRERILAGATPALHGVGSDLALSYWSPLDLPGAGTTLELRWSAAGGRVDHDPLAYPAEALFAGPFLNARVGAALVELSDGETRRVLDFKDFTIRIPEE